MNGALTIDAFIIGGAACTVRTVGQLTRIRIDHDVVIDFVGFVSVVDALVGDPRRSAGVEMGRLHAAIEPCGV